MAERYDPQNIVPRMINELKEQTRISNVHMLGICILDTVELIKKDPIAKRRLLQFLELRTQETIQTL
jgi:hypothetical protein